MNKVNYQKVLDKILLNVKGERLLLHSCCGPCSSYVLWYLREYFRITVYYYNPNITDKQEYYRRKEEQLRFIKELNDNSRNNVSINKDVAEFDVTVHTFSSRNNVSLNKAVTPIYKEECRECENSVTEHFSQSTYPITTSDTFSTRIHPPYPIDTLDSDYEPELFFETVRGFEQEPEGGERCRECFSLRLESTAKRAREGDYDYFCTTLSISPLKNAELLNEIGNMMAERYKVAFLPSDFKKKDGYKKSIELSREYDLYRQDYCGCVFSRQEIPKD